MSTETQLVEKELNDLIRAHNVTVEFFADMAHSGLISMTPGMIVHLVQAREFVEKMQREFVEYNLLLGGGVK